MMRGRRSLAAADVPGLDPGTIVAVRISGVWHEGIVDQERDADARPHVWNKSKRTGRVEREPWAWFARDLPTIEIGYLGTLPAVEVLARARAAAGEPWSPVENCQRFARRCHGVAARSPDLDALGVALLLAMVGGPLP